MTKFECFLSVLCALSLVFAGIAIKELREYECEPYTLVIREEVPVEVTEEVPEEKVAEMYDIPLDADLQDFIIEQAEEKNIDPTVVFGMAFRESSYNASAIGDNGNSYGLCQIQPRWNKDRMERLGVTDLLDPYQNVTVAIDLLAELKDRHDGDIAKALVSYNQGRYNGVVTSYAQSVLTKADELRGAKNGS